MNYKSTNKLLKKGGNRAIMYQVLCCAAALVIVAPASYLYGVMQAGEGVNTSLYARIFSESAQPVTEGALPDRDIADALWALGMSPIEKATYNGLAIWTTNVPTPSRHWERDLAREWSLQGLSVQAAGGTVQGFLRMGRDHCVFVAKQSQNGGYLEIFAYEKGEVSTLDAFVAVGLPSPPREAEVFDYSGTTDGGVALAFRSDLRGDVHGQYSADMQNAGWKLLPNSLERKGASLFERHGNRVTLRSMESGDYTYVTLVVF